MSPELATSSAKKKTTSRTGNDKVGGSVKEGSNGSAAGLPQYLRQSEGSSYGDNSELVAANRDGARAYGVARIPADVVKKSDLQAMAQDVETIAAMLKQQILFAEEEQEIVTLIRSWTYWDVLYAQTGGIGTPFLDKFLSLLKQRTLARSTGRTLFGLAGDEFLSAYDGLFYELEDERLEQYRAIVAQSRGHKSGGPETQQMQSVYGFVGKRVGLGAWGIVKQMGLTVASIADAAIWAEWRSMGYQGKPPQLSPGISEQFDLAARALADMAKEGATPAEIELEKQEIMAEYGFGDRWGQIVGLLMSAGMGGTKSLKVLSDAVGIAQGAQGVEAAALGILDRIDIIKKLNPTATWEVYLADDEVRLQFGNGFAALIGLMGGLAGDEGATALFLKRFHLLVDASVLTPLLKKAWMDYNSPDVANDPTARSQALESNIAVIIGTIAAMVGSKYDAKRMQEKPAVEPASHPEKPAVLPAQPHLAETATSTKPPADAPGPADVHSAAELWEPHPADPKTGVIKGAPEWVPETGTKIDPAMREELLLGLGSWIGEAEVPVASIAGSEPAVAAQASRLTVDAPAAAALQGQSPQRMGGVTAGPEGIVEHVRSTPLVEIAPSRIVASPERSTGDMFVDSGGQSGAATVAQESRSKFVSREIREEFGSLVGRSPEAPWGETSGLSPGAEQAHFAATADEVRDQAHPRLSSSTTGPQRVAAALEVEAMSGSSGGTLPGGAEADVHPTVPDEVPAGGLFEDPNAQLLTLLAYLRPTGFPVGMREMVWESAKGPDGIVRDPLTRQPMKFTEPWHMGHKPEYEFWRLQRSAFERGISRAQFIYEYYNIDHFQPELPISNISHAGESKAEYEGP